MSNYFVLRGIPSVESAAAAGYIEIEDWDGVEGFEDWGRGTLAKHRPAGPVQINAVPHDGYLGLPDDFQDHSVPLVSKRLKMAIESAAVDNVIFFPVTLRNTGSGEIYDYFAFNLLGLLSVLDAKKGDVASYDGDFIGDSQIHTLAIDETKCRNLLMFRLKEKFSVILVHQIVKEAIERGGVSTVRFVKIEDFMAL